MSLVFQFRQNLRVDWEKITENLIKNVSGVKLSFKKDFEIEIRPLNKKRSGQQLKAFWVIIKAVTDWMNEKGNVFTSEQVSDYFKILSGHCSEINGQTIPKSIANKSSCTREQMETLITAILVFGAENLIDGCYIEDRELQELLNYYK